MFDPAATTRGMADVFLGSCVLQNFNVLLSRHNPNTDKHAHFLVQPRAIGKERSTPVPVRKV
jgi:hypothetical protein